MGRKGDDNKNDGIEIQRNDYTVCLDASRQQTTSMPTVPLLGATRLTCYDGYPSRSKHGEFRFPGQVIIKHADKINGCILQMRVIIADKKDSHGRPIFFDVKIMCPNFEPTTAYINGKKTKMSIQ